NGNSFGAADLSIAPHAQVSHFLTDAAFVRVGPFGLPASIEGTFTFDSTVPVSAIAVRGFTNERAEFLMTTLPVVDLTQKASQTTVVIPDFAEGGGWTTSVALVNVNDAPAVGMLEVHSNDGAIVRAMPYAITPSSSAAYPLSSSATAIQTGWIRVIASGSSPT